MRTIKFRVWDYQNNCWAKESEANISMGFEFGVNDYYINIAGERMARWSFVQFTGLTDKNGKEIYEGDIIKKTFSINYNSKSIQREMIYIVKFKRHKFYSAFELVNIDKTAKNHTLSYNEELIIIGNIYENPELLK